MPVPEGYKVIHQETAKTTPKSDTTPVKIKVKLPPSKYELHVSGDRESEGYNDFKMVLKKNGKEVEGYTFIVGRDAASGHSSYVGKARISIRQGCRKEMQPAMGLKQSNIERGNNTAIHAGRSSHRHITLGCIRMDEPDLIKLFDYLEKENSKEVDKWFWFKHVYVNAQPINSKPNPKYRVPLTGNAQ
jgi:hypothetical protein